MTPMPLSTALQVCFPHGGVSKSTLLDAIGQGKLKCFRLGRSYMVTETDIDDWMKSCRVEKRQGSTLDSAKDETPVGSFSTTDESTTQVVAEVIAQRLRNGSVKSTSRTGSDQTLGKVIRPKFRSRKS